MCWSKADRHMPLYEYQCQDCDHRFEVIQKFSDPPVEKCPKCGGPVRKLMSSPAIQFRGSGWYVPDRPRKDSTPSAKSDGSASSDSAKTEKGDKASSSDKSEKAGTSAEKATASPKAPADPVK